MSPKVAKWIVWCATATWATLGLLGMLPAMFAPMLFDAPGSTSNPATVTFGISLVSFPFVCGLSLAQLWRAFFAEKYAAACAWSLLPLGVVIAAGAALTYIMEVQNGQFAP